MYIAGLQHHIEPLVVLSVFSRLAYEFAEARTLFKRANASAGPVKPTGTPAPSVSGSIVFFQLIGYRLPSLIYLISVGLNGWAQPQWLAQWALPEDLAGDDGPAVVRAVACVANFGIVALMNSVFNHLGPQFHFIGVRERPKLVSTGPYTIVRHPLYSLSLLQQLVYAGMFWSYIPLYAFGILAATFAVKMRVEEALIEKDIDLGTDYIEYKKKVTSKVIPYVW